MRKILIGGIVGFLFLFGLIAKAEDINPVVTSTPVIVPAPKIELFKEKAPFVKINPNKIEIKAPPLNKQQLGEFKDLDDFVREKITNRIKAEFFFLNPVGFTVQQGIVDRNENNILTINSQGFKIDWHIGTDTKVISSINLRLLAQVNPRPINTTDVKIGERVKIFGIWNGSQFLAKKIIVLERKTQAIMERKFENIEKTLENLKTKIKESFGVDLSQIIEQIKQQIQQQSQKQSQ